MARKKRNMKTQLQDAIRKSGRSLLSIAKESQTPYASLHTFVNKDRAITIDTASRIADALGLELRPKEAKGGK